jgi:hypothetical protein
MEESRMSNLTDFTGGGAHIWVTGTTYSIGNILLSPSDNYTAYVRITNGAGSTDPSADSTNYRPYGARPIKSIQRGVINLGGTLSATATITSVVTGKCELRMLGQSLNNVSAPPSDGFFQMVLTNATTITASRGTNGAGATTSWELTEFY